MSEIDVIAPNLKRRLSGVTATVVRLIPVQARMIGIVATGPGLPEDVPHVPLWRVPFLPRRPRVWHARRNSDLLAGVILKRVFRMALRMVFTSSSPRERSGWTRWLVSHCDRLVATAPKNAAVMPMPCTIIPHGVDTQVFQPQPRGFFGRPDTRLIGCFGRVRDKKGTADFVTALCQVLPQRPGWGGVIMGRIQAKDEGFAAGLRAQIAQAGLADRIVFHAEAALAQMPQAYSDLAIYVAPSHLEGFGLTPIEAMACGVPVVATRGVGAFDDQVEDGVTGHLVSAAAPDQLAEVLAGMIDAPVPLAAMAGVARAHVEARFSLRGEAEALNALYRDLLAT